LLPRQDIRKEALKEAIAKFLKQSTTMKEFQNKITAKGYEIELGRGIAFTDAQAVRFKGSQVGYPLLKIEKQLAQNRQQQQQQPSMAQKLREVIQQQRQQEQLKQKEEEQQIKQSGGFRL
jgi:hypothetical protein